VLNNSPYDLAAAALIASEAGAIVTDAAGEPFDERPLLGSAHEFQMSVAIASNRVLHQHIVEAVAAGLDRLKSPDFANPSPSP
jgi:fructose-1,6-bisphosphatase/inositol monophosphatase family enzyme